MQSHGSTPNVNLFNIPIVNNGSFTVSKETPTFEEFPFRACSFRGFAQGTILTSGVQLERESAATLLHFLIYKHKVRKCLNF